MHRWYNNVLIRSGEAPAIGWSRNMLYSGFIILPRSVFWSADLNGRSDNTDVIRLRADMKRKLKFSLLSFFIALTVVSLAIGMIFSPAAPGLSIQVVGNCRVTGSASARIRAVRPTDHFHVVVTNESNETLRLWEERSKLGHLNISFELMDSSGKLIGTISKSGGWAKSYPDYLELKPGQHRVIDVYLERDRWRIPLQLKDVQQDPENFQLVAKYSIGKSAESEEYGIWVGSVETDPVVIELYGLRRLLQPDPAE